MDEIIDPFPNFNGETVEVWERISNFITHFTGYIHADATGGSRIFDAEWHRFTYWQF